MTLKTQNINNTRHGFTAHRDNTFGAIVAFTISLATSSRPNRIYYFDIVLSIFRFSPFVHFTVVIVGKKNKIYTYVQRIIILFGISIFAIVNCSAFKNKTLINLYYKRFFFIKQ